MNIKAKVSIFVMLVFLFTASSFIASLHSLGITPIFVILLFVSSIALIVFLFTGEIE